MTREEKIAILKDIIDGEIIHPQVRRDVGTWAIKTLEQEPCDNVISRETVKTEYKCRLESSLKDESRGLDLTHLADCTRFNEFIDSIPPVNPQYTENEIQKMHCQLCQHYRKDGYCEELELYPCYPEKGCDYFSEHFDLTPCDDAVSRQAAIKAITNTSGIRGDVLNALYDLPPVTPQPKTGHWLMTDEVDVFYELPSYECSKCGQTSLENGDYCPNCGCRMVGIGDRVKFKTIGGWYNSGIIKDIDEDSYLIEVDQSEDTQIPLPYYLRVLSSLKNTNEFFVVQEGEEV